MAVLALVYGCMPSPSKCRRGVARVSQSELLRRWLSADGAKPVGGSGLRPQEVLDLRGEAVLQLAAGAHSSAAVTGDGRLMLWGKLLAHVSLPLAPHHLPAPPVAAASGNYGSCWSASVCCMLCTCSRLLCCPHEAFSSAFVTWQEQLVQAFLMFLFPVLNPSGLCRSQWRGGASAIGRVLAHAGSPELPCIALRCAIHKCWRS